MRPDIDRAATAAMETLIKYKISSAPVLPFPIFKSTPGVLVLSFAEISDAYGIDRKHIVNTIGEQNQDAVTTVHSDGGRLRYVVTYNQRLPFYMLQRSLARELGHIVLGHDGVTRSNEVRRAEAVCFAHHLISPRPIIKLLQESGTPLTMNVLANTTGCSEECVDEMQTIPGTRVPAELNRRVKEMFARGIREYLRFHAASPKKDTSPVLDFGTYMDGYEE